MLNLRFLSFCAASRMPSSPRDLGRNGFPPVSRFCARSSGLCPAEMQHTLGNSLLGLGEADQAIHLFEKALETRKTKLGPDHLDTLTSMSNLAGGFHAAGRLDLALPLYEETLKLQKDKLGTDHPDTLNSMSKLASGYSIEIS